MDDFRPPSPANAAQTVVLVEGTSDEAAVERLATARGIDLAGAGVVVQPMDGATNIGRYLERYGPAGAGHRLCGLCDAREEPYFRRALARAGIEAAAGRDGLAAIGFFVCDADLEDELIAALGTGTVQAIIAGQGQLESFRRLQQQPAQRGRSVGDQLHRFMGSGSGRKLRYAALMVDALDAAKVPAPLDRLLESAVQHSTRASVAGVSRRRSRRPGPR